MAQFEYEKIIGIFQRDNFVCRYCGFDGNPFLSWNQLTVDHIIPKHQVENDNDENLATCCHYCNILTSRINIEKTFSINDAFELKRKHILERHIELRKDWEVATGNINS